MFEPELQCLGKLFSGNFKLKTSLISCSFLTVSIAMVCGWVIKYPNLAVIENLTLKFAAFGLKIFRLFNIVVQHTYL